MRKSCLPYAAVFHYPTYTLVVTTETHYFLLVSYLCYLAYTIVEFRGGFYSDELWRVV
jgi:hypothetical protein